MTNSRRKTQSHPTPRGARLPLDRVSSSGPLRWSGSRPFNRPNVGTWMYNAASGWLMTRPQSRSADGLFWSRLREAFRCSCSPSPAGALADTVDKRALLIGAEIVLTVVAAARARCWSGSTSSPRPSCCCSRSCSAPVRHSPPRHGSPSCLSLSRSTTWLRQQLASKRRRQSNIRQGDRTCAWAGVVIGGLGIRGAVLDQRLEQLRRNRGPALVAPRRPSQGSGPSVGASVRRPGDRFSGPCAIQCEFARGPHKGG